MTDPGFPCWRCGARVCEHTAPVITTPATYRSRPPRNKAQDYRPMPSRARTKG
jgi:hypothetical protein